MNELEEKQDCRYGYSVSSDDEKWCGDKRTVVGVYRGCFAFFHKNVYAIGAIEITRIKGVIYLAEVRINRMKRYNGSFFFNEVQRSVKFEI